MSSSVPKRRLRDTDWSLYEGKIKQLYVVEDKPLGEVMDIMSRDHGFRARYVYNKEDPPCCLFSTPPQQISIRNKVQEVEHEKVPQ
ncbi:hypothetical protein GQ53DRAFT_752404 [Thozetella sp. PMI_491]|nr:hypothetical protein GQ53DRAFT_752404 [Thozetella sp. PMI_491]